MPTWGQLNAQSRLEVVYRHYVEGDDWRSIKAEYEITGDFWRRRAEELRDKLQNANQWPPSITLINRVKTSPKPKLVDWQKVEGDALVLNDPHIPYHDAAFINKCTSLAVKWGILNCVIGGDLFDMAAFSTWLAEETEQVEQELMVGEAALEALGSTFKTVLVLRGNHDDRLLRQLARHIPYSRVARLFTLRDNIIFSEYYHCDLVSNGKTWRISHPKNISMNGAIIPARLASKYQTNVIAGHGHLWGSTASVCGQYHAIDSGICADPERIQYTQERDNVRPVMMQGAVIVRNGYAWLLHPTFTDWDALLKL